MTRPPIMSDSLPPHLVAWLAGRPAARMAEATTTARAAEPLTEDEMEDEMDDPMIRSRRERLALFDALGTYAEVRATCDDHKRMCREREAEAWVSVDARLPDDSQTVLIWQSPGCAIMGGAVVAQMHGGEWHCIDGRWRAVAYVTHWKPIVPPEKP